MNGIHDLGGTQGHGPINPPASEPVFSHEWEGRVFALFGPAAVGAGFNIDEFRHGIERMGHAYYLESPYYVHWLETYIINLEEKGILTRAQINARMEELREEA